MSGSLNVNLPENKDVEKEVNRVLKEITASLEALKKLNEVYSDSSVDDVTVEEDSINFQRTDNDTLRLIVKSNSRLFGINLT